MKAKYNNGYNNKNNNNNKIKIRRMSYHIVILPVRFLKLYSDNLECCKNDKSINVWITMILIVYSNLNKFRDLNILHTNTNW